MVYDDGRHYEGCWDYGRYHGHSSTSFPTITIAAEVNTTVMQKHGRGVYWWEDGRVHVGHFRDNQRHGQGSYLLPDGSRYTGSFIFRKMHGHETHMFHCGSRYEGEYQYGQSDGNGILHYASGHQCEGRFLLGHWHGRGIFSIRDGSLKRKGQWMRGEPAVECSNQDIQRV